MCYVDGMPSKFVVVMIIYAFLTLIGISVLHGKIRWAILILFGGLAVKTLIARRAGW
jgi:hypothetical protein